MSLRIALPLGTEVKPGRYYRTRGGTFLGPTILDKPSGMFTLPNTSLLWTADGTTADTLLDFVAEVAVKEAEPEGVVKLSMGDVCRSVRTRAGQVGEIVSWNTTPKIPPLFDHYAPDPFPLQVQFGDEPTTQTRYWYSTTGFVKPVGGLDTAGYQLVAVLPETKYSEGDYVIAGKLNLVCRVESGRAVRVRGDGASFDLFEISRPADVAAIRGALRGALNYHLRKAVDEFRKAHPGYVLAAEDITNTEARRFAEALIR